MRTIFRMVSLGAFMAFFGPVCHWPALAQEAPAFTTIQPLTNQEFRLQISAVKGSGHRLEISPDLSQWQPLLTFTTAVSSLVYTDSATPAPNARYYRAQRLSAANFLTGDHLPTEAGDLIMHPINHATFVMSWNNQMIYVDPVGGAGRFAGLARADVILITHNHTDHFDNATLNAVKSTNTVMVAPPTVYQSLTAPLKALTVVMANQAVTNLSGMTIEAVPAYNLTSTYHVKGAGNGYVLTLGGRRVYIAGDTEDIPEMRQMPGIDVAFVPMNLPYTMTVDKAASAVREFRPAIVYPYHSQGSDVTKFKNLVGKDLGIEVRLRKWY